MTDFEMPAAAAERIHQTEIKNLKERILELETALTKALARREQSAFKNTMMPERFGERLPEAFL